MKLESQVCNLDLSKKLKELGVKQESYFYWDKTPMLLIGDRPQEFQCVSAFTVAELGAMLPIDTDSGKANKGQFSCWMVCSENGGQTIWDDKIEENVEFEPYSIKADTEADARAKMLIYLIENGLVKVEENKR